jgi:excisionase family DNA binding protein
MRDANRWYLCRVPKSLPEELESKPGLLNVKDISQILGLHPETVRDWARQGRLPHVRVGYAIKFDRHRIADWIRAREMAVPVTRYRAPRR